MDDLVSQLHSHLKGTWKYRWYAMAVAWLVVLVGGLTVYLLPNRYEASARVFVDTQSILKPLLSQMTTIPNIAQQVTIMSRTLINRPNVEKVMRMVDMDIKANTAAGHEQLVDALMKDLKVTRTGSDDIYTISYNNENPKVAKDVVQSLLTVFIEGGFGDKKQDSDKAVQFLDEQIKSYEEKLASAENALKEFKQKNADLLPHQGSGHESKLSEMSEMLSGAKLQLAEAEQARDAIKKQIAGEEPAIVTEPDPSTLVNPEIDARIQSLRKNLDALELQFTQQHPDIISTKRLIAQLETRKLEEAKQGSDTRKNYSPMLQQLNVALSDAEQGVAAMKARVNEYSSRVSHLKAMSNAVLDVEREFSQLNRDYLINKENYEKLVGRREAAKLAGDLSATTELVKFRVIDPPTTPQAPVAPKRPPLFAAVFIGALMAGIAAAFLMSQIRPAFVSQYLLGTFGVGMATMRLHFNL